MGESTREFDSSERRSPWIGFVTKNEEEAGAGLHARELSLLPATLNILLVLLFFFFELVNGVLGFRLPLISEREK